MTDPIRLDFDKLRDFAMGNLSREESSLILRQVEIDPELSEDLELVLALLRIPREDWDRIRHDGPSH